MTRSRGTLIADRLACNDDASTHTRTAAQSRSAQRGTKDPPVGHFDLANVNSRSRSLYAIGRPSVVCNARAPYAGGSNFRQYFYGIRYVGHPLTIH